MTDREMETVVRDMYHSHEHLVAGRGVRLVERARFRGQRRRVALATAGSGLATLVVVIGVGVLGMARGPDQVAGPPPVHSSTPRTSTAAPPGWRLESSLGVELAVPEGWATNDIGCGMTQASSAVRGRGAERECFTPEPAAKELAIIEEPVGEPFLAVAGQPTSVVGVPASRAEGQLPDGRHAGWILIESLNVRVEVRTRDVTLTRTILNSVHVVDVDHVGCLSQRPALTRQSVTGGDFVDPHPVATSICYYGSFESGRLQSSFRLTGESAQGLAMALTKAQPGPNPDQPSTACIDVHPPVTDVVLLVESANGQLTRVWVTFSSCTGRGMDNGVSTARVTQTILHLIMEPLHTGYAFNGDLPR